MISLECPPEPPILVTKKSVWTRKWLEQLAKGKSRPESKQYAHPQVREHLRAMTRHKCAYCERTLRENEEEVDHFVSVHTRAEWAFRWENLHLSCRGCNDKLPDVSYPPDTVLDPADRSRPRPEDCLCFERECVRPRSESQWGDRTIQKFRLDRGDLDLDRSRALLDFNETLRGIQGRLIREQRTRMTPEKDERIRSFASPSHAFSAMFQSYLNRVAP